MERTVVIADAHLGDSRTELDTFLDFLAVLEAHPPHTLSLLGDLCNIWIGSPGMTLEPQRLVTEKLASLRAQHPIRLKYVEGNRDYFLAQSYLNAPFHEIATEALEERIGEKRFWFSHGDLVNRHDRQYRLWRAFSRNPLIFSVFRCLPRSLALRFAHFLEQRFRSTNQRHKKKFPHEVCAKYAEHLWKSGYDTIMLGHFHEAHHLENRFDSRQKHLYILPAWKDTHIYASIDEQGEVAFRNFSNQ